MSWCAIPYYFAQGLPKLDAIVEMMGVNDELEWLKYEAGEIDVSAIPPAEFPARHENARGSKP